jgi:hypothetical protein
MNKLSILFILLGMLVTVSCKKIKPGNNSAPRTTNVEVFNPMYRVPVGPATDPDQRNFPDLKIRIYVQTFDGSGNAVVYKNYADTYPCNSDNAHTTLSFLKKVDVPSTGSFVIQVIVEGLECVFPQSGCERNISKSGQIEYTAQQTLDQGIPATVVFTVGALTKTNVDCCQ